MGVDNDAILCYGIEFSYDEIKHLKDLQEIKDLAENIGCDFMPNLWEEMGFVSASYYYDAEEEDRSYIIGTKIEKDLTLNEFVQKINENEIILFLKGVCDKYNLKYEDPKILCRPNVW